MHGVRSWLFLGIGALSLICGCGSSANDCGADAALPDATSDSPIGSDATSDASSDATSNSDSPSDSPTSDAADGAIPQIGDKCAANADCGSGGVCVSNVPGGGYCSQDCTTAPCPSGATCIAFGTTTKRCLRACQSSSDCRTEQLCNSNLCVPKCTADTDCESSNCNLSTGMCGPSRVGTACAANADCGQFPAFCATGFLGGYCSLPCGGTGNATCPVGSNCTSAGGTNKCLVACQTSADCRSGYQCLTDVGGTKSCVPPCHGDADCGLGLRCDTVSGACVQSGPTGGVIGAPCAVASDCTATPGAPFCGAYPGGYCSTDCSANPSICGAGAICVSFGAAGSDCLNTCTSAASCRAGYRCAPVGATSVCLPPCRSNADCGGADPVCDTTSGSCVASTSGTGTTRVETVDLTAGVPVTVGTSALSAPITATIPADAVSVDFVGLSVADPTARLVVYRIETPDGRIYDYGSLTNRMKVLPPTVNGSFSVLAPNSPTAPFSAGTWTLYLLASKPTTATVKALIKHAPSPALSAGSVDMNLFFVGLPTLNATNAPTDANFQGILSRVRTAWAAAGLSIGNVKYLDVTGANATTYQDLQQSQLGALMQLSADPGASDNALNVFFVRTLSDGTYGGNIILGQSAGIPGVPVRGTTGSGIAVTTADFPQGLDGIAATWVHEASHWLGLFHVTESAGTAFDPIPDTPECPASTRDANHDGVMEPSECVGFGADNTMFWTSVPSIPNHTITPNQSFVLLRNPAVH